MGRFYGGRWRRRSKGNREAGPRGQRKKREREERGKRWNVVKAGRTEGKREVRLLFIKVSGTF